MRTLQNAYDVAVVGGSIAGCASAILFAKMGHKVVVFEQKTLDDEQHYKRLCTHFVQPSAVPVLDELGLQHLRQDRFAIQTRACMVTDGGVIDHPAPYGEHGYALNLERRVFDPALRSAVREHGISFVDGCEVNQVERTEQGWVLHYDEMAASVSARLLIAADGRQSRLAKQLDNTVDLRSNDRAAVFGYFKGIPVPELSRSLFILHEGEMGFLYPLIGGRTLLSVYISKQRAEQWRESGQEASLLAYFATLPGVPDLSGAKLDSAILGYKDYPNQLRQPVHESVAFVGDAVTSLDPMSGVGCGFALCAAHLLAKAFAGRTLEASQIDAGLEEYALQYRKVITPHVAGICADSLIGKDLASQQKSYQIISGNPDVSAAYLALTGRLILPAEFQRAFLRGTILQRQKDAR